jgi:threonine synthase
VGEVTGASRLVAGSMVDCDPAESGCLLRYAYAPSLLPPPAAGVDSMWRYRDLLPVAGGPVRFPLPVGGSPLIAAPRLGTRLGLGDLWLKDETRGTSASNKDRATALVIESGLRHGADTVTVASTGNAAVATALGAAAAGLRATIFVPASVRPTRLALMLAAGARVLLVEAGYDTAFRLSREAAARFGWLDRNTGVNPLTIEAKKSVAFEVWEQLDRRAPDVVAAPVGDGPTLCGVAKGFRELVACGAIERPPRLLGVQAAGCQPLVRAWEGASPRPGERDPAGTIADGIAVSAPSSGDLVLYEVRHSDGAMVAVPDAALLEAIGALAATTGVLAEPAGAAAVAGLAAAFQRDLVSADALTVALVTGRELQAPASRAAPGRSWTIRGEIAEVEQALLGE